MEKKEIEVKLITYLNNHWYSIKETQESETVKIASFTTKLGIERKQFLERWRGEVTNRVADEKMYDSQQKGKRIHHALYVYLNGGAVLFHPYEYSIYTDKEIDQLRMDNKFFFILKNQDEMVELWKLQRWFEAVNPEILQTEKIVYSIKDNEAGTLDVALKLNEGEYLGGALVIPKTGIYIADLKTGAQVEESAWSQMAGYGKCFERMGLGEIAGAMVLHTQGKSKKGISGLSTPIKTKTELEPYYDIYKHLAAVWDARNPGQGPVAFSFPSLIKMSGK